MVQKKLRGRPPKDDASRTADRQALIDAAFVILRDGGARALTARSVAERAGTAVGSVYTQFENLEALRLEANAITMRVLRDALAAALVACRATATDDRLLCLAEAYGRFASEHHHAWAALFERRTIEAPPAIMADIQALFGVIEEVLRRDGRIDEASVPVMARALWSSVHGMVYLGEIGGLGPIGPAEIPLMVEALVRAAVKGLGSAG